MRTSFPRAFVATLIASFIGTIAALGYLAHDAHALRGVSTSSSVDLTSPGPIGSVTPGTGAFTTLTANNLFTLTGVEDSIAAFGGGGQASATALSATKNFHRITTVTTAGDSVKMPAATVGQLHYVRNDGVNPMQVFGTGTDTINGIGSGVGVSLGNGMSLWFVCTTAGQWTVSPMLNGVNDGTATLPSIAFASQTASGIYRRATNTISFSPNGTGRFEFNGAQFSIDSSSSIGFLSGAISTSADLTLTRDATDTLAQRRGTNAQCYRAYNTFTDASNYERGEFCWSGNVLTIQTANAGTGTLRGLNINAQSFNVQRAGATLANFNANGIFVSTAASANQLRTSQTTAPTVTTNGGTSPSCTGSDVAMTCTIGTAPPAAATFTVTFNGTWPTTAPSCTAIRGTTGTTPVVAGVVTSTTTVIVNLSANLVASEKYHIHCIGVS